MEVLDERVERELHLEKRASIFQRSSSNMLVFDTMWLKEL